MSKTELIQLGHSLRTLTVFRALLNDDVISALTNFLISLEQDNHDRQTEFYCSFVYALLNAGSNDLADHIRGSVSDDENVFIRCLSRGKTPSDSLRRNVRNELAILQQAANLTAEDLCVTLSGCRYLPEFDCGSVELVESYRHRASNLSRYGYGIYSRYYMFCIDNNGNVVPVRNPDSQRLSDLIDYKREQKIIMDNTRALLAGKPAANILLTGDAGTGKSSTIKAVVNELKDEGLRILEVRKEQLGSIPFVLDALNENPLKFILFIDDLSFQQDDDNFAAFKAILEGSVSAKSNNVVIYATSNRRHMVNESFSARNGDDIHRNDTMQETVSLSERFGIQILFRRPDKYTYLNIVRHLAEEAGLDISPEELEAGAERFALGRANRSARAARQYVDSLLSAQ